MKKKGFTLIELLVVIAIIALLMAVLMPALTRVRKQAKAVVCMTRLKQWSLNFAMYANDNDGFYQPGYNGVFGAEQTQYAWPMALARYHSPGSKTRTKTGTGGGGNGQTYDYSLWLCPMASKPIRDESMTNTGARHPYAAWGMNASSSGHWSYSWTRSSDRGSYGINGWVCNPGVGAPVGSANAWETNLGLGNRAQFWRTPSVRGGNTIPLFGDCTWVSGWPNNFANESPEYSGDPSPGNVCYFALDRHSGFMNMLFVDSSVRKVGLKELWTLRWHRGYDTGDVPPWAPWMRNFKDYAASGRSR